MRGKKTIAIITLSAVILCNQHKTFADNVIEISNEVNTDFVIDMEKLGFIAEEIPQVVEDSENKVITILADEQFASDGEADVVGSLTSESSVEFFIEESVVLNKVAEAEAKAREEALRIEKENKIKWIKDYGVDPSTLSDSRVKVLSEAYEWMGSFYLWGGIKPPYFDTAKGDWVSPRTGLGFDCSSYVQHVIRKALGIDVSRTTYTQIVNRNLKKAPISEAKAGDIHFTASVDHVGFYLSDVKGNKNKIWLLHCSKPGDRVKISQYNKPKYIYKYVE